MPRRQRGGAKKEVGKLSARRRNSIAVTEADAERLTRLLQAHGGRVDAPRTLPALQRKLDEADLLNSRLIPKDVVTMNSSVRLRNLESGEAVVQTLAFPHGADPAQSRVSILTSLGVAMLGHRKGDVVNCEAPGGPKRFRIERVLYQPEAANDDDR